MPSGAEGFALICEDPDAPGGTWHHWAVFDMPSEQRSLPEGMESEERIGGLRQGLNDFRRIGYGGPCPPRGRGAHRYRFRLFALRLARLDLPARPPASEVWKAGQRQALAEAVLSGTYERR